MMILLEKISQTCLHMTIACSLTYLMTGSWAMGGILALVEPICNVLLLPFHNNIWRRIRLKQKLKNRHQHQVLCQA